MPDRVEPRPEASPCPKPWRAVLRSAYNFRKGVPRGAVHLVRCDGEDHDRVTAVCGAFRGVAPHETFNVHEPARDCRKCLLWAKHGFGGGHAA